MLGKLLAGRYKIIAHLGEGGFGQTYLAQDHNLPGNPRCVVKHLKSFNPKLLPTARRLFDREARCLQKLGTHSQIPQLFAYFEEDQEFYLAEEYIEGHPLSHELASGNPWSEQKVFILLQEILSILQVVHEEKVIHRDIKPSNIIRRKQDGKLVLIDFGSVKQLGSQDSGSQGPIHNTVAISTTGYTPLEQLQGKPRYSSDIYALGVTAVQTLTGNNPRQLNWDLQTGQLIWRHQVSVSEQLAVIVDKMVHHDYQERYRLVEEVLTDLDDLKELFSQSTNVISTSANSSNTVTRIQTPVLPANASEPLANTNQPALGSVIKTSPRSFKPWQIIAIVLALSIIGGAVELIYPVARPMYYLQQGKKLLETQQPQEALSKFGQVLKLNANNAQGWKGRGDSLRRLERLEAAIAAYDKAIKIKPKDSEAWQKKGATLYQQDNYPQALSAQEKAIELDLKNAKAWSGKGIALLGLRRYEDALEAFKQGKTLEPESPRVWQNQALALEALGRRSQATKIYEEALAAYNDILAADADDAVAWVDRGGVLSKLKRHEEAIYSYDQAVKANPNFHLAWDRKANALYFLGRYDEALQAFDKALAVRPKSYQTWHSRGSLLAAGKRDFTAAIKSFDKAIGLRPSFYHAWRDRGLALSSLGRQNDAIASFDRATKIEPEDYKSWMGRGIALMAQKRYREALISLERARDIQPGDPFVWMNLGLLYENMGNRSRAIASYEQALQIDPSFPPANQALEKLR